MSILIALASTVCVVVWSLVFWFDHIEHTRFGRRLKGWYWTRVRR